MDEVLRSKYRLTFLRSDVGMGVLADILRMCHFGETLDPDNPAQVAEHNIGTVILFKLGYYDADLDQVINAMAGVPPRGIDEEDKYRDET